MGFEIYFSEAYTKFKTKNEDEDSIAESMSKVD
jgi:hypothetical protein